MANARASKVTLDDAYKHANNALIHAEVTYRKNIYASEINKQMLLTGKHYQYHRQHISSCITADIARDLKAVTIHCENIKKQMSSLDNEAKFLEGSACFFSGKYEEAKAFLTQIIFPPVEERKKIINNEIRKKYASYYNRIGELYIRLGQDEVALTYFCHAIAAYNKFTMAYYNLAILYRDQNNFAKAHENFCIVIDGIPGKAKGLAYTDQTITVEDLRQWIEETRSVREALEKAQRAATENSNAAAAAATFASPADIKKTEATTESSHYKIKRAISKAKKSEKPAAAAAMPPREIEVISSSEDAAMTDAKPTSRKRKKPASEVDTSILSPAKKPASGKSDKDEKPIKPPKDEESLPPLSRTPSA